MNLASPPAYVQYRVQVQRLKSEWPGSRYHLQRCNCNHFTDALAELLTGNKIPKWVNRLANLPRY